MALNRGQNDGSLGWRPLSFKVRVPWASHATVDLAALNNRSAVDFAPASANAFVDTSCNPPIAFVPIWSVNFAETFLGTVIPLLELAGSELHVLRHSSTRLIVDVLHQHMHRGCRTDVNGPCATPAWFEALVSPVASMSFLHRIAPQAFAPRADIPPLAASVPSSVECYSHLRFCHLRSVFDRQPAALDVWAAAQRFAELALAKQAEAPTSPGRSNAETAAAAPQEARTKAGDSATDAAVKSSSRELRVLFERRLVRRTMGRRSIYNLDELLQACAEQSESWAGFPPSVPSMRNGTAEPVRAAACNASSSPSSSQQRASTAPLSKRCTSEDERRRAFTVSNRVRLVCSAHTFGRFGLASDIRAVRAADVLIGMHGAGLTHGFFMRRHSVLVEVRPFGFEGNWPDYYFRQALLRPSPPRVFHLPIAVGDPDLCHPNRGLGVTPQEAAHSSGCVLPWSAVRRALLRAAYWMHGTRPYSERNKRQPALGGARSSPEERYLRGTPQAQLVVAYNV